MSLFFGIEMGKRALSAFKYATDIASHNVSNVNTPGFHRQSAIFNATPPYAMPSLSQSIGAKQVGTGVEISQIYRHYDSAIENRVGELLSTQGKYDVSYQFLSQIENLNAMKSGISDNVVSFFNAWNDVANNPEDITKRSIVIQRGSALATEVNYLSETLINTRTDIDKYIQENITEINNLLKEVRDANALVRAVTAAGDDPNDLLDQRDIAINNLREYVDVQVEEDSTTRSVNLYIGGRIVVQEDEYLTLTGVANVANSNYVDIKFSDDLAGANAIINDGKMKGLLDLRDSATSGVLYYKQELDTFATDFITAVNAQHNAGFDLSGAAGGDFFSPVVAAEPALNMEILPALMNSLTGPQLVAASATAAGVPGDGNNALTLARLANQPIIGAYTAADYWAQVVSHLGSNVKDTNTNKESTDSLMTQLENLRDSVSGVSLDEEAANLVQYEKSYQAAARIVTTYTSMIDEILKLVG